MQFRMVVIALALLASSVPALAQKIGVKSATPSSGAQGSAGLEVVIGGNGFGPGAQARFVLSGTDDPDGISVRSTRFVSSSQLVATIDIADAASLAYFDIKVTLSGRTGKGTDLFQVVERGPAACVLPAPPAGFSAPLWLNGVLADGPARFREFGTRLAGRPLVLDGQPALLLAAMSTSGVEIFAISEDNGAASIRYLATAAIAGLTQEQWLTLGEVDEDPASAAATPDILVGSSADQAVYVLRGQRSGSPEVISYGAPQVLRPSAASVQYGYSVATANLDGDAEHEIVVSELGGRAKGKLVPGKLHIYDHTGALRQVVVPTPPAPLADSDLVGRSLALADVTGDGLTDIVAGVPGRAPSGQVWVFEAASTQAFATTPRVVEIHDAVDGLRFGRMVAAADLNGDLVADLLATTDWTTAGIRGSGVEGPILSPSTITAPIYAFTPLSHDAGQGWARGGFTVTDFDGDGARDVVVGAAHAEYLAGCGSTGAVYLFRQCTVCGGTAPRFEAPIVLGPQERTSNTLGQFGHGGVVVAEVGGVRVLVVSDFVHTVGSTSTAGQVYVYRMSLQ